MKWKSVLYDNASDLYNGSLANYELQYSNSLDEKKKSKRYRHNFSDLFLDDNFDVEPKAVEEELDYLRPMLALESDKKEYYGVPSTSLSKDDKKEVEGLKILTQNKLLT